MKRNYRHPEAEKSISVFSSIGWRRGGGIFWRYVRGASPESEPLSSDDEGL